MQTVVLRHEVDFATWRAEARRLVLSGVAPEQTVWAVKEASDLFGSEAPPSATSTMFHVPRAVLQLAETVIQARDPARFAQLYSLVWRVQHGEKHLLKDAAEPLVQKLCRLAQAVRRDTHKMRAFLRFRAVAEPDCTRYVAWFEPDHYIVEANAAFFIRRFATMRWSILTPYRSAHWDGDALRVGDGASPADIPDDDALEKYWRAYFSSIFNPARLKVKAMTSEMPRKYWHNLPEAAAIPDLVKMSRSRTEQMVQMPKISPEKPAHRRQAEKPPPPPQGGIAALAADASNCRLCSLWQPATQIVFGEGPADAKIMLVGEQPGDQEDLAGRPFIGPAGQILDRALADAGLDRSRLYITNAVKHFKFEPRGKRRIHATPDRTEIEICRVWLDHERALIKPDLTVVLGASAARAVLGRGVTISRERGRLIETEGGKMLVTVHPSYLLRLPDESARAREYAAFVADLRMAAEALA